MKAIMVMFDSLNRRYLEPYGCTNCPTSQLQPAGAARRAV